MRKFVLIAIGWMALISAQASPQRNCSRTIPPLDAAVTETNGLFFYVFPRGIDKTYNGCQTMWDEKGKVWFTLTFHHGRIVKFLESSQESNKAPTVCKYQDDVFLEGPSKECPAYESIRSGFRTFEKVDEPSIPANRDPRKGTLDSK
jgi:hypothetical protein